MKINRKYTQQVSACSLAIQIHNNAVLAHPRREKIRNRNQRVEAVGLGHTHTHTQAHTHTHRRTHKRKQARTHMHTQFLCSPYWAFDPRCVRTLISHCDTHTGAHTRIGHTHAHTHPHTHTHSLLQQFPTVQTLLHANTQKRLFWGRLGEHNDQTRPYTGTRTAHMHTHTHTLPQTHTHNKRVSSCTCPKSF